MFENLNLKEFQELQDLMNQADTGVYTEAAGLQGFITGMAGLTILQGMQEMTDQRLKHYKRIDALMEKALARSVVQLGEPDLELVRLFIAAKGQQSHPLVQSLMRTSQEEDTSREQRLSEDTVHEQIISAVREVFQESGISGEIISQILQQDVDA